MQHNLVGQKCLQKSVSYFLTFVVICVRLKFVQKDCNRESDTGYVKQYAAKDIKSSKYELALEILSIK